MRVLLIFGLIFSLAILGNAQSAILSGSVYDAYGALIVKAKVTAINEKFESFEAFTDSDGIYKLELPFKKYDSKDSFKIAKYVVTVESPGFEKFVLKGLNFVPSTYGKMSVDFALDIDSSNCGAGGCISEPKIAQNENVKLSNEIIIKPLAKLPKAN